jgi:hypothetical protein
MTCCSFFQDVDLEHEWDASRYGGYAFLIKRIAVCTMYQDLIFSILFKLFHGKKNFTLGREPNIRCIQPHRKISLTL